MSTNVPISLFPSSGESATNQRNAADGTELDSSGKITDAGSDVVNFVLPDGTGAVNNTNSLGDLYGGMYWDLGDTLNGGITIRLEWSSRAASTVVCIGVARLSSAPTSLADLETDSVWLQVNTKSNDNINCFHKEETQNFAALTTNTDDLSSSTAVDFQIVLKGNGFERRQHQSRPNGGDNADNTAVAVSSGNWYLFIAYGAMAAVSGADKTIALKFNGGWPL